MMCFRVMRALGSCNGFAEKVPDHDSSPNRGNHFKVFGSAPRGGEPINGI